MTPFIAAFNRGRDSYQLALALNDSGQLERLITDYYAGKHRLFVPGRLANRHAEGLPAEKVIGVASAFAIQSLWLAAQQGSKLPERLIAALIGRAAARHARRTSAHLFLYSTFAREAFADPLLAERVKGLFVFHPHPSHIRKILSEDVRRFPCAWESYNRELEVRRPSETAARLDAELELADFVVTASSFTHSTCSFLPTTTQRYIAPYGLHPTGGDRQPLRLGPTRFLFVGQGVQRKGLHHLIIAWRQARKPQMSLDLVLTYPDPGILALAAGEESIAIHSRLSVDVLNHMYADSDVFVLPSLVEGFGLVFLEALANGLHLVGTTNTGLPDLKLPSYAAQVVSPGDIDALSNALVRAHDTIQSGHTDRERIRSLSKNWDWPRFRRQIASIAKENG